MTGITRYADVHLPMDEAMTRARDRHFRPAVPRLEGRPSRGRRSATSTPSCSASSSRRFAQNAGHHAAHREPLRRATTTISPRPASRRWRARCAPRSPSTRARTSRVPSTKGRADRLEEDAMTHLHRPRAPPRDRPRPLPPTRCASSSSRKASAGRRCSSPALWLIFRRMWLVLARLRRRRRSPRSARRGELGGAAARHRSCSSRMCCSRSRRNELRRWTLARHGYRPRRRRRGPQRRGGRDPLLPGLDGARRPRREPAHRRRRRCRPRRRQPPSGTPSAEAGDVVGLFPAPRTARP